MKQHGLIQTGWVLEFDRAKKRFGFCSERRKVISLSIPLCVLNDIEPVKDTILHEIAHALVGNHQGHNNVWKRKCIEIGAKPERCFDSNDAVMPPMRYSATCKGCGKVYGKARMSTNVLTKSYCNCQKYKLRSQILYLEFIENKFVSYQR